MDQTRNIIFIIGPMAVGKMTVAHSLQKKTNFDLLHNHLSIEVALGFYNYDTDGFTKINEGIRNLVFQTIAEDPTKIGFIFTCVWAFDQPDDQAYIQAIEKRFAQHGWTSRVVELTAPLAVRLKRNKSAYRLMHKPSKKNIESSEQTLLAMTEKHRLNSRPGEIEHPHYLRIDNTHKSADQVAEEIIKHFHLPAR